MFSNSFLITHAGCLDGTTCGLLFVAAGGSKNNIIYSLPQNHSVNEYMSHLIDSGEDVLLVDVAPTEAYLDELEKSGKSNKIMAILDHHASSVPLAKFDFCDIEIKNERCGSKMFYDWLVRRGLHHGENNKLLKYKELVTLVDDIDRWVNLYPESKILATLHENLSSSLFFERFLKNSSVDLTVQEQYLIDIANKKREISIKRKKKKAKIVTKDFCGHTLRFAYVTVMDDDPSMLGYSICIDPQMDVDIAVIIRGEGVSFRSSPDCPVDISKIASKFGGGGHAASAGCDVKGVLGKELVDLIIENMRLQ